MEGRILSHYRVLHRLGGGGMGVVYKAEDTRLKRSVALKFLPPELTRDPDARQRFEGEARAASALDHPNICTIYEIDSGSDDQLFIAMAYCHGETLKLRLQRGPLPIDEAVEIAIQVARGLDKAHHAGIIHRDIKPANLMLSTDGDDVLVKIVDFGIAKLLDHTAATQTGTTLGTVGYMAPEQISGGAADARTDVWALGVVLYEMLTGRAPFGGDRDMAILHNILNYEPTPVSRLRPEMPRQLERIVESALAKQPIQRCASAADLARELSAWRSHSRAPQMAAPNPARRNIVAVAVSLLAVAASAAWVVTRDVERRRVDDGIAEASRLADTDDYDAALRRALLVRSAAATDRRLVNLMDRIAVTRPIESDPPGASVSIKSYADVDGGWHRVGRTPMRAATLPRGVFRWKAEKDGYDTLEFVAVNQALPASGPPIALRRLDETPRNMVRVPPGNLSLTLSGYDYLNATPSGEYLIDKYEVTNRDFKVFVDAGGYTTRTYWKQPFVIDGRVVPWEQATGAFHDRTGRAGPATWEVGTFPSGQDDFPVGGVSWYEAAAYAEFTGKRLPTIYHWLRAASMGLAAYMTPFSNFADKGPMRVGSRSGVSGVGTFDMAGNVREWCWNEITAGQSRYILGGAWSDPEHIFLHAAGRAPDDRSDANGFRLVKYLDADAPSANLAQAIEVPSRDYTKETPASEEVFRVYRSQFAYDPEPLDARVESVDAAGDRWTRENVSFKAAYGNERVLAHLFLPKNARPPYQVVVYFPGAGAIRPGTSDAVSLATVEFLMLSGRAVMFPVYKGTYERNTGQTPPSGWPSPTKAFKEWHIQVVNDVRRSVDYLQTRSDIQAGALAYYGFSWGSDVGTRVLALEPRFKVGVLLAGGFAAARTLPEVDALHFAPRVTTPVLLIDGASDFVFQVDKGQKPYVAALGTAQEHKRYVVLPGGHDVMAQRRSEVVKEILDWVDRYLGPVER